MNRLSSLFRPMILRLCTRISYGPSRSRSESARMCWCLARPRRAVSVSQSNKQGEFVPTKEKEQAIEATGLVVEEVRGAFRVKLDNSDHVVLCRLAGKMRKFRIRVVPGDKVRVEMSPYDLSRGRITFRER